MEFSGLLDNVFKYKRSTMINVIVLPVIGLIMGLLAFVSPKVNEKYQSYKAQQKIPESKTQAVNLSTDNTTTEKQPESLEQKISDENFKNWILTEVKNLEVPVQNPIAVEENTKNFVNQLSGNQIQDLKIRITNSELPINERIFSNYALMKFSGPYSNQNMYDLASHPVPEFTDLQPHSEDELKRAQEYALKYSNIDELSQRAEAGDELALTLLTQLAHNTIDLKIKNYAQRKINEIRP